MTTTDDEAARLISAETVGAAMQEAWDDFTSDTGCYPPDFEITRGPRLWANFVGGQIASGAACQLRPAISAALSALTTKIEAQGVEIARLREALDYLLGDRSQLHPMFGGVPTVRDLAYNAFMSGASGKNADDGGACDWFNDTLPLVDKGIELMRAKFVGDLAQGGTS